MTRPMPGPPEDWWYCTPPHGEPGLCTADMDPAEYMPFTHLRHKRLTDAECAAEHWREQAEWWAGMHQKGPTAEGVDIRRAVIWERFATRPHALEEA